MHRLVGELSSRYRGRMNSPLVSVLIPTFNRAQYVGDAVRSSLAQTLDDIEVLVVDDGSTDDTAALLATFSDPRLRVVRHDRNRGIPRTRNTALSAARGRFVAWLDSDDMARSNRLAEQVAFLERHPDIAMVGACAGKLRADGSRKAGVRVPPLSPEMIAAWLLFRSAFQQSSIMGRADILQARRYDPDYPVCEDIDMFLRLQRDHRLANLPRVLVDRRLHPDQSVRQHAHAIQDCTSALIAPALERLGMGATADDLVCHALLGKVRLEGVDVPPDFLDWARCWLGRLGDRNDRTGMLDSASLALASDYFWLLACRAMAPRIGRRAALAAMMRRRPRGLASPLAARWLRTAAAVHLTG